MNAFCKLSETAGPLTTPVPVSKNELEFLAFTLGNEEYGIDLEKVQELRGYDAVTHIADLPGFITGIINLRGLIVPIIDLRIKFKLGNPIYDELTVVIILNIADQLMGMVVDSVSDVVTLTTQQIEPAPYLGTAMVADYLIGLGTLDERMLILLDLDMLMSNNEKELMEKLAA